jgi:transposase
MVFMQDNAPVHTAIVVKEWLQEMAIESINWPPYSPDLNPIEHAWMRLKETIYQLDPHIESYRGTKEEIRRYFKGLIEQAWIEISQDYFNNLIESMPRRVEAVIAAQGWYTKY